MKKKNDVMNAVVLNGKVTELSEEQVKSVIDGLAMTENTAGKNPLSEVRVGDTEHHSPYHATVSGMLSPDYKERFKAEYQQTKIRYEKLKAFCNRVEAAFRTESPDCKRIEMPKHDCPLDLLRDQQRAMGEYLHCLEIRAVIEGIEL